MVRPPARQLVRHPQTLDVLRPARTDGWLAPLWPPGPGHCTAPPCAALSRAPGTAACACASPAGRDGPALGATQPPPQNWPSAHTTPRPVRVRARSCKPPAPPPAPRPFPPLPLPPAAKAGGAVALAAALCCPLTVGVPCTLRPPLVPASPPPSTDTSHSHRGASLPLLTVQSHLLAVAVVLLRTALNRGHPWPARCPCASPAAPLPGFAAGGVDEGFGVQGL